MKFKENLKKYRKEIPMTQAGLAKETGLTADWISHYETGKRLPSLPNLIKLADALDLTLDDLVGRNLKG